MDHINDNENIVQQEFEYNNGQINIITTYRNGDRIVTNPTGDNQIGFIQQFINGFNNIQNNMENNIQNNMQNNILNDILNIIPNNIPINDDMVNSNDESTNDNSDSNDESTNDSDDFNSIDDNNNNNNNNNNTFQINNVTSTGLLNLLFNNTMLQPEIIQINNNLFDLNAQNEQSEITLETVQNEINDIIDNRITMDINEFLQNRIIESVTYIFDITDNLIQNDFNNAVIRDIVRNGLNNNYLIEDLINNLYVYLIQQTEHEDVINSLRTVIPQITYEFRRNHNRRNRFFSTILQGLNNLQNSGSNNISEQEFDNKFTEFTHKYSEIKQDENSTQITVANCCAICKCDFEDEEHIICLECTKHTKPIETKFSQDYHYFHKECIKEWMTKHHAICPLCKTSYK